MTCPLCEAEAGSAPDFCQSCRAPLPGAKIHSRYEIQSLLGKGGMGAVYKAWDASLEEPVAFKVLRSEALRTAHAAQRFRREIKLARKVRHPNVCAIHEYGELQDLRYIVMEYVEGEDLHRLLRRHGPLPAAEAVAIVEQVALGLQAMHDLGILHRDLKPPNVMRDPRGVVRVMDLGIAKSVDEPGTATTAGLVIGTPQYMSPEQARGERLDHRSDVYALGVLTFELLTGRAPFHGTTPVATILMVINDAPPLDGPAAARLSVPIRETLRRALAKRSEARHASVRELAAALREAEAAPAPAPAPVARTVVVGAPPAAEAPPVTADTAPGEGFSTYVAGLEQLQRLELETARQVFENALRQDPELALAQSGLGEALIGLGHDERAREASRRAVELATLLSHEERQLVEARHRTAQRAFTRAAEIYAALWGAAPGQIDLALGLARAQLLGQGAAGALPTLERLRRLEPPLRDDPRIELLEAELAGEHSDWHRQREVADGLRERAQEEALGRIAALSLLHSGTARHYAGEAEAAAPLIEAAHRELAALGDRAAAARAIQLKAAWHAERGEPRPAKKLFETALREHREIGDRRGAGLALAGLAPLALGRGAGAEAAKLCSEALAILRDNGPPQAAAGVMVELAEVRLRQGDLGAARRMLDEAVTALRGQGDQGRLAAALTRLAEVLSRLGELPGAQLACDEALALARSAGDSTRTIRALRRRGLLLAATGDFLRARAALEQAIEAATAARNALQLHECQLSLGRLLLETGSPGEAERLARAAVAEFARQECPDAAARAEALTSKALLDQGQNEPAWQACRRALLLSERSTDPEVRMSVSLAVARQRMAVGRHKEALLGLDGALQDLVRRDCYAEQLDARLLIGEIEVASGKRAGGRARLAALEKEATGRGYLLVASKARMASGG